MTCFLFSSLDGGQGVISKWNFPLAKSRETFVHHNHPMGPISFQSLIFILVLTRISWESNKNTECWIYFNSKQLSRKKFLQNPFLRYQWSVLEGKRIICTVESVYLMIWTNCQGRKHQSIRKLLGANLFLKILCSGFYCTDNSFSLQDTPLAS